MIYRKELNTLQRLKEEIESFVITENNVSAIDTVCPDLAGQVENVALKALTKIREYRFELALLDCAATKNYSKLAAEILLRIDVDESLRGLIAKEIFKCYDKPQGGFPNDNRLFLISLFERFNTNDDMCMLALKVLASSYKEN